TGRILERLFVIGGSQARNEAEGLCGQCVIVVIFNAVDDKVRVVVKGGDTVVATNFFETFHILTEDGFLSPSEDSWGQLQCWCCGHDQLLLGHEVMRIPRVLQESQSTGGRVSQIVDNSARRCGYSCSGVSVRISSMISPS